MIVRTKHVQQKTSAKISSMAELLIPPQDQLALGPGKLAQGKHRKTSVINQEPTLVKRNLMIAVAPAVSYCK